MFQLYLLSVLFNVICGFFLYFGDSKKTDFSEGRANFSSDKSSHRIVIGIISAVIGFLKLLRPVDTLIIGDIIPAIGGLLGGFILIFDYYKDNSARKEREGKFNKIAETFIVYKKIAGIVLFIIAGVHFLLPDFLFL